MPAPRSERRLRQVHHKKQLVHRECEREGGFRRTSKPRPDRERLAPAARRSVRYGTDSRRRSENIRKLLVQNGYFDPKIDPQFQYDEHLPAGEHHVRDRDGKRAQYETPQISGDTSVLSEDAITKATHWRRFLLPGYRGITLNRTRSGIDNIRLKYENANRLLATVVLNGIDPEEGNEGQAGDHRQRRARP